MPSWTVPPPHNTSTDSSDRAELIEALTHPSFTAQRQVPRCGNAQYPSKWDLIHARIDEHLTLLELAE